MFRALRVFRGLGVEVTPMPVPDVLQAAEHWNGRFPAFETMLPESGKIANYQIRGWSVGLPFWSASLTLVICIDEGTAPQAEWPIQLAKPCCGLSKASP